MAKASLPFQFVDGTTAYGSQVYANDVALLNAVNAGVDNTDIGSAGIFASQIIPTSVATATFGGTQTYIMPAGLTVTGTLTASSGVTVAGTLGVTGAATFSSTVAITGLLSLTAGISGSLTLTGSATATSFIAGSSTYGSTSASIAGGLLVTAAGSATSVLASVPPVLSTAGANYGAGVKIVTGIVTFAIGNGVGGVVNSPLALTGPAQFLVNPPAVFATPANAIAGWVGALNIIATPSSGAPPYTQINFSIAPASGSASSAQTLSLNVIMIGA
jgi:hypothetical protein